MPKTQKRFRAAKPAKYENLTVFIVENPWIFDTFARCYVNAKGIDALRFAVHAAEAGMKIKGAELSARSAGYSEAEAQ